MDMKLSWGDIGTVVLSGLVIVFIVLVVLIFIVWLYGKIFDSIEQKKSGSVGSNGGSGSSGGDRDSGGDGGNGGSEGNAGGKGDSGAAMQAADASDELADGEIPGGVIAAIAAAVAVFTDGKGVVTGVRKKAREKRRSTEWGYAGTLSSMQKFNRLGR
jgi:hypothetical protein